MPKTGMNNTSLKQQNRGLILKLIATGECNTRIELARKTGLSKMAVSNIVGEFLNNDTIEEDEKVQIEGKGRNPVQLCISKKAPKMIGVHLYRERCSVVLCDLQLTILNRVSFSLNEKIIGSLLQEICSAIDAVLAEAKDEEIFGIGIGAIGPVDNNLGKILEPPNFYGVHDLNLQDEMEKKYQLPVYFDSESNCAALAEKYYGSGRDCEDFIYLDLANGIGSGVILKGRLYANTSGMVCELGHTSIDWQGEICGCGNKGCLERYVSSNIVEKQIREAVGEKKSFQQFCLEMNETLVKNKTGAQLSDHAAKMDAIFQDMTEKLTCGITGFVNGLNPEKIIIGHEGYWIPDHYLAMLEQQVNQRQIAKKHRKIKIVKSYFASDATVYGCACSLLTAIFEGQLIY